MTTITCQKTASQISHAKFYPHLNSKKAIPKVLRKKVKQFVDYDLNGKLCQFNQDWFLEEIIVK
jgi:hypothetical protein